MVLVPRGLFERVCRHAPLPGGRLPGEDKTGNARPRQAFRAPASLRVRRPLHIVMELADGYRPVTVLLPPGREQVSDRLSAPVTLLRLAHPLGRVLTAKSEQRITYPPAPLSEAAEREAGLDVGRDPPTAKL
jgi:hypothetical protein